eukprot:ANDGO_01378.mRNA.1 hypothetical protein
MRRVVELAVFAIAILVLPCLSSAAIPSWFGNLPASYDLRNTSCYLNAIQNQGICGDCYSVSSSTVMSIVRCMAQNGVSARPADWAVVSSQFTSSVAYSLGGVAYPCGGGDPLKDIMNAWASSVLDNGAANVMLTCSNNCTYGCDPNMLPVCPESQSQTTTGSSLGVSAPSYCTPSASSAYWSTTTCPQSTAGTSYTSNFSDPAWAWVTSGQISIEYNGSSWSTSTISSIMSAVNETGAVVLTFDACDEWQSWVQSICPASTHECDSGCFTQLKVPLSGSGLMCYSYSSFPLATGSVSLGSSTVYYYVIPTNTPGLNVKNAFNGTSCSCSDSYSGHAVSIVGWLEAAPNTGQPAFIVQNSWGPTFGDGGYFYLDMASFANFSSPTGSVFPVSVSKIKMIPRSQLASYGTNALQNSIQNNPPQSVLQCFNEMDAAGAAVSTQAQLNPSTGKLVKSLQLRKAGHPILLKSNGTQYEHVRRSLATILGAKYGQTLVPQGLSSITQQVVGGGKLYRGTIIWKDLSSGNAYQTVFTARSSGGRGSNLNGGLEIQGETTTQVSNISNQSSAPISTTLGALAAIAVSSMLAMIL